MIHLWMGQQNEKIKIRSSSWPHSPLSPHLLSLPPSLPHPAPFGRLSQPQRADGRGRGPGRCCGWSRLRRAFSLCVSDSDDALPTEVGGFPSRIQSTGDQLLKAKEKKKKRNQSILKAAFGQDPLTSPIPGVRISGSLLSSGSRGFALGGEEEHGGEEGRQRKLAERFPRATCFLGACRSRRSGPIIIAIMTLADARGGTACRKPFSALHVGAELTSTAVSSGGSCYSLMSQPRVVKPRDGRPPDPGPAAQR